MGAAATIIAMPDMGENTSGAIAYWRLSGAIDYDDLEQAWTKRALDPKLMPSPVTPGTALKRTMQTFKDSSVLVRPLREEREGFVLVHEQYVNGRPSYTNGMEVSLVAQMDGTYDLNIANVADEISAGEVTSVFATWRRQLGILTQSDISSWLVHLVRTVDAVRLRDTGGIYFIPRYMLPLWDTYVAAIRESSSSLVFQIPAMKSDEAINAIVDAMTNEAQEAVEAMAKEIDTWGEEPNKRAVNVRTERLRVLEEKLGKYESLLGVKLDELRGQVGEVGARLAEAALMADGVNE
jgi:hypothetical protein